MRDPVATHHRIEGDCIRLHYRRAGTGDTVVLPHGSPQTSYAWREVMIAPDVNHWHGAAPGRLFVHLSVQQADGGGRRAICLEQVTDADYRREAVASA